MRFKIITNILGLIVEVVSLFMLLPLGWAVLDKSPDARPIFVSMIIGMALGAILLLIGGRLSREEMRPKEALVAVGLSWILASAIGSLPFWLSGAVPTFADAFFESVSGFTTTRGNRLGKHRGQLQGNTFLEKLNALARWYGYHRARVSHFAISGCWWTSVVSRRSTWSCARKVDPKNPPNSASFMGSLCLFDRPRNTPSVFGRFILL